jgi:hypothetical protein
VRPADFIAIFAELKNTAPVDAGKRSYGLEHVVYPVVDIVGGKTYEVCGQSEDHPQERFGMVRLLRRFANNRPPFTKGSGKTGSGAHRAVRPLCSHASVIGRTNVNL